jgi:hypothetical protein
MICVPSDVQAKRGRSTRQCVRATVLELLDSASWVSGLLKYAAMQEETHRRYDRRWSGAWSGMWDTYSEWGQAVVLLAQLAPTDRWQRLEWWVVLNFWRKNHLCEWNVKKDHLNFFCQKGSRVGGGMSGQATRVGGGMSGRHVSPAAWATSGMYMPPPPTPAGLRNLWWGLPPGPTTACWCGTCRLSHSRHPAVLIPDTNCTDSHANYADS